MLDGRLITAARWAELDLLRQAAERGASLDDYDSNGHTLVHIAVSGRQPVDATRLLVELGVNLNARTRKSGETALHFAAKLWRVDVARMFLDAGALPSIEDTYGNHPLWYAVFMGIQENRGTDTAAA